MFLMNPSQYWVFSKNGEIRRDKVSFSPTFYLRLFVKKIQKPKHNIEKKFELKILMKLTQGVIFNSIFKQLFRTKVFYTAFTCLHFVFGTFCGAEMGPSNARKMLVKLTTGLRRLHGHGHHPIQLPRRQGQSTVAI